LQLAKDYSYVFADAQRETAGIIDGSIIEELGRYETRLRILAQSSNELGLTGEKVRKFAQGLIDSKYGSEEFRRELNYLLKSGNDFNQILVYLSSKKINLRNLAPGGEVTEAWSAFISDLVNAEDELDRVDAYYSDFINYVKSHMKDIDFTKPLTDSAKEGLSKLAEEYINGAKDLSKKYG
jgi:hypothetical protein